MFESIEEAISVWKEEFSFIEDAKVTGYDGVTRFIALKVAKYTCLSAL